MGKHVVKGVSTGPEISRRGADVMKQKRERRRRKSAEEQQKSFDEAEAKLPKLENPLSNLETSGILSEDGKIDEVKIEEALLNSIDGSPINWENVDGTYLEKIKNIIEAMIKDPEFQEQKEALELMSSDASDQQMTLATQGEKIAEVRTIAQEIAESNKEENNDFEEKRKQLEAMVNELGEKEDRYNAMSWFKRKMSAEGRTLARDIKELQKKSDELSAEIAGGPQINVTEQAA